MLQRQVEDEEEASGQAEHEAKDTVQAKRHTPTVATELEGQLRHTQGHGQALPKSTRQFFEPRFGQDFGEVRLHADGPAAEAAKSIQARAFTHKQDIYFGAGQYQPDTEKGKTLLAHELTHTVQQNDGVIRRGKGKVAKKIVGWIVKVGERKLIKVQAVYTEKQMAKLLAKGYHILVKEGKQVAKNIAKKVWGDNVLHQTGHIVKKTGKKGLSHFQPARQLPKSIQNSLTEKGWHIFYSTLAPVLFFSDDVQAMAVYEDKYPGPSLANALTFTYWAGEDSWLSYLDWVNPLELVAIGGDIGRNIDREKTKKLKLLVFNTMIDNGVKQTYEMTPEGDLLRVIVVHPNGKRRELSAKEYFDALASSK